MLLLGDTLPECGASFIPGSLASSVANNKESILSQNCDFAGQPKVTLLFSQLTKFPQILAVLGEDLEIR